MNRTNVIFEKENNLPKKSEYKPSKFWVVYNPKTNGILEFNNQTIKGYLMEHPYKLAGRKINIPLHGETWIDFITNSEYLEGEK